MVKTLTLSNLPLTPYQRTALTVRTMQPMQLTDATFDEVLGSADTPVLVEFGATWCGPCKMMEPVLAQLADEQEGRVLVATIDIDDTLNTSRRFEVMAAPTLMVFVDGRVERRLVGARGKRQLLEELAGVTGG